MDNQEITLDENQYQALYMCDDYIGLTPLIAKELSINLNEANDFMNRLINKGLVIRSKGDLKEDDEFWYYLTELGRENLYSRKKGQRTSIAPKS